MPVLGQLMAQLQPGQLDQIGRAVGVGFVFDEMAELWSGLREVPPRRR